MFFHVIMTSYQICHIFISLESYRIAAMRTVAMLTAAIQAM